MHTAFGVRKQEIVLLFMVGFLVVLRLCVLGATDLLVEEAYYWNYSQHLDWSYLDHPPMVALLIRASTLLFGTNEFAVRILSLLCWVGMAWFSVKWVSLIAPGVRFYVLFLLSILPFFFLQSMLMTPDQPLLVCWAAVLYALYRALVMDEPNYWFMAGAWLGIGLLSKYTIVLLGLASFCYMVVIPGARHWFGRREPYLAASIAMLFFMPVIYWNATHQWASFVFQSSRRIHETFSFSLHQVFGLLFLFLTPMGCLGLWRLYDHKKKDTQSGISLKAKRFMQVFTGVPLVFFSVFSLTHPVHFNWIGPGLLAMVPWLASSVQRASLPIRRGWLITGAILMMGYTSMLFTIAFGLPDQIYRVFFSKYMNWERFTLDVHQKMVEIEQTTHSKPVLVALDRYNIASEFLFYQAKLFGTGQHVTTYLVRGSDVFGGESLMYRYWVADAALSGKYLVLLSDNPLHFNNPAINQWAISASPIQSFWATSPYRQAPIRPYYYQVVRMRP